MIKIINFYLLLLTPLKTQLIT